MRAVGLVPIVKSSAIPDYALLGIPMRRFGGIFVLAPDLAAMPTRKTTAPPPASSAPCRLGRWGAWWGVRRMRRYAWMAADSLRKLGRGACDPTMMRLLTHGIRPATRTISPICIRTHFGQRVARSWPNSRPSSPLAPSVPGCSKPTSRTSKSSHSRTSGGRSCEAHGFTLVEEIHASLVEHHGTQEGLFSGPQAVTTEKKSFFRRLAEKKGSPRIDHETVLIVERS